MDSLRCRSPSSSIRTPDANRDTHEVESPESTITLRCFLEKGESDKFDKHGIADIPVNEFKMDKRLAAMQRALVAHDALTIQLKKVDAEAPTTLKDAIAKASELDLIVPEEVRYLKFFNKEANSAKHDLTLPF